jgi:hypothetical protein
LVEGRTAIAAMTIIGRRVADYPTLAAVYDRTRRDDPC